MQTFLIIAAGAAWVAMVAHLLRSRRKPQPPAQDYTRIDFGAGEPSLALRLQEENAAARFDRNGGPTTFESKYFTGRFFKKGTVHLKWKREDLWERFNQTAAEGKKWLAQESHQARRPRKRSEEPDHYCKSHGHKFIDGECERCGDPEVDEVATVECELCRAIFEHTGIKRCPIHAAPELTDPATLALPPQDTMTQVEGY